MHCTLITSPCGTLFSIVSPLLALSLQRLQRTRLTTVADWQQHNREEHDDHNHKKDDSHRDAGVPELLAPAAQLAGELGHGFGFGVFVLPYASYVYILYVYYKCV